MALLAALDSAPYLQISHLLSLARRKIHARDVTRKQHQDAINTKQFPPFHIGTRYHTSSKAYLTRYVVNILR